jgi:ABC-type sugar transport system ATPase subunit
VDRYDSGEVLVAGRRLRPHDPAAAIAAGVALVPEDRRQQGLVMELPIERNTTLTGAGSSAGWASRARCGARLGRHWAERLQVKAANLSDPVSTLSGGNQQKVVLAKWLATRPKVLIVDEPTRGIDVGTKAEVHRLMSDWPERAWRSSWSPASCGGARHGRSHPRDARGEARGRDCAGRRRRGGRDVRGHRSAQRGHRRER